MNRSDAAVGVDAHSHDGSPHCVLCKSQSASSGLVWCSVVGSLVCPGCCLRITEFDPETMIEALERTEVAIAPGEVAVICATCQAGRYVQSQNGLPT